MDLNTFKTIHFCLPVTALQVLQLTHTSLILSGQGPFLSVTEPHSRTLLGCQRALTSASSIHGIACDSSPEEKGISTHNLQLPSDPSSTCYAKVLVWGGSSICVAKFRVSCEAVGTVKQRIIVDDFKIGATFSLRDWILNGSLAYGVSSSDVQACLVTAHNELRVLPFSLIQDLPPPDVDFLCHSPQTSGISTVIKPLIYSACIQLFPPETIGVLGGTAFGTICTWNTQPIRNSSQLLEYSTGHQGITFGVDRFDKRLATCSDDRGVRLGTFDTNAAFSEKWRHTSRVWGVKFIKTWTGAFCLVSVGEDTCCKVQQITKEGLVELVDDRYHSGKNIWAVADARMRVHQVITGGADGGIVSRDIPIHAVQSSLHAAGSYFDHEQVAFASIFTELDNPTVIKHDLSTKPPSVKRYVFTSHACLLALTDSGYLYSIAKKDEINIGRKERQEEKGSTAPGDMSMLSTWSIKRKCRNPFGRRPVLSDSEDNLVFMGDDTGELSVCLPTDDETAVRCIIRLDIAISWLAIAAVRHVSESQRKCYIVVYCNKKKLAKVVVAQIPVGTEAMAATFSSEQAIQEPATRSRTSPEAPSHTEVCPLDLPKDFVPTSARVLYSTRVLVLGSRKSVLAIYRPLTDNEEPYRVPLAPFYHSPLQVPCVHGSDSITSIHSIPVKNATSCKEEHFLTTGRDGTYATHSVSLRDEGVTFQVLDIATSPFKFGIEGSYCVPTPEPSPGQGASTGIPLWCGRYGIEGSGCVRTGDLVLYGFDSEKFVVWNESRQSLIFSIQCGNIHRAWAYNTYAFLQSPDYGPFAWSQAGFLHLVDIYQTDHSTIQQGGHGREIKALSVSPLPYQDHRHDIYNGELVATGAEDTTIRFFAVGPTEKADARKKMILIRTVKKHNTGIQCLSFSSCGKYLFSSGGCEELYAWRIRHSVPGVNLGVVLDYTFPEDMPNSDLRITNFMIRDYTSGTFLVSAVYSNSMIRVFHFNPAESDPTEKCQLQRRFFYQTNCLTHIHHDATTGMITASTDGHLASWPSTRTQEPADNTKHPHLHLHRIHQNSIQAMRTVPLPSNPASIHHHHHQLIITGGDDNALGLTLLRTTSTSSNTSNHIFQSLRLPTAHAAAITAICLLFTATSTSTSNSNSSSSTTTTIRFLSASNDQRVKLWQIRICHDKLGHDDDDIYIGGSADMAAVDVDLLASTDTNVADVAGMELLSFKSRSRSVELVDLQSDDGTERRQYPSTAPNHLPVEDKGLARVVIVGVGMEVLEFTAERVSYA